MKTKREREKATIALRDVLRAYLRSSSRADVVRATHLGIRLGMGPRGIMDAMSIVDAYVIDGEPMVDPRSFAGAYAAKQCDPGTVTQGFSHKQGAGHDVRSGVQAAIQEVETLALQAHMGELWWGIQSIPMGGQ
jgi:hypothetical protein